MELKKELMVGIIGSILIIFLTILYFNQYQKQKKQFTNILQKGSVTQTSTVSLTLSEVAKHNMVGDCWIIVQGSIYNVTQYLSLHPGGSNRITTFCGQDATNAYSTQGGKGSHSSFADSELGKLKLGQLNETVNFTETNNQIQNNIKLINSSGKNERENENDD